MHIRPPLTSISIGTDMDMTDCFFHRFTTYTPFTPHYSLNSNVTYTYLWLASTLVPQFVLAGGVISLCRSDI